MKAPALKILTAEEVKNIYEASLEVLEQTGMLVDHEKAREMLEAEGAKVDHDAKIVRYPRELVEAKLKLLPKNVTYKGRTPEFDCTLSVDSDIYARVPGGATNYIDLYTGEFRRARLEDWRQFVRLVDAMPNVGAVSTLHCGDAPHQTADVHSLYILLTEQRKCILHNAFSTESQKYIIEMALAAAGGKDKIRDRSQVRLVLSPISPLYLNEDDTEQLLQACEYGIPTDIPIMPIAGSTSPITLAGTLVQANAEYLGTMVLAQTARPGHDMPFFVDPVVSDMRTGFTLFGAPETAIIIAAISQLGREIYGMPGEAIGLDSDGFTAEQNIFQKTQNVIMEALAGGKLMIGAGSFQSCMALDPAMLIIDNEIMDVARRLVRGMTVDKDTLAVEAIHRVGPRGHFLMDDHTFDYLHTGELIDLHVFDRCTREEWEGKGSRTLRQKAAEKAKDIISKHAIAPLDAGVARELKSILESADRNLVK